jgi:hypothetical protein
MTRLSIVRTLCGGKEARQCNSSVELVIPSSLASCPAAACWLVRHGNPNLPCQRCTALWNTTPQLLSAQLLLLPLLLLLPPPVLLL